MSADLRRTGEFCWVNILTPRPAEAMDFFARVLGWTYFETPGYRHGVQAGGRNIGGLFDLEGPKTPPGVPCRRASACWSRSIAPTRLARR